MDRFESLLVEWLLSGEEIKFFQLLSLSWGPIKDSKKVLEEFSKSMGLRPEQCNANPAFKTAYSKVFQELQVSNSSWCYYIDIGLLLIIDITWHVFSKL